MKKKLIKFTVVGVLFLGVFSAGSIAEANNNWFSALIADGIKQIGGAGYNKKDEIVNNLEANVSEKVKGNLQVKLDENKKKVEDDLQAYFDEKVAGLENETEYQEGVQKLDDYVTEVVDRYKLEIDAAFNTTFGQ